MLPFLQPKKLADIVMARRTPSGNVETKGKEGETPEELTMAAEELIQAISAKNAEMVAHALRACWAACEAEEPMGDNDLEI